MTPEQAAQRIAEALNGGEWRDGRWYTEGQRQAWIAAVTPVLEEIAEAVKAVGTDPLTQVAPAEHRAFMAATAFDCAKVVTS